MKQTIICILIFCCGFLVAADNSCNDRQIRANQKYYKCAGEYSDDFTYWLMKFIEYGDFNSTNLDDVAIKSTAICEKFMLHVQCTEIRRITLGENCMRNFELDEQFHGFKRNILKYFCDNDAHILQQALANNGYTAICSGTLNLCMADINEGQLFGDVNDKPTLNVGYICSSLNGVFNCLKESVETAENKNLTTILQGLFTIVHDMLKCSTN